MLSVTFHRMVRADDVTTLSTGGMIAGNQVLNKSATVLLLDGCHWLEATGKLYLERNVGRVQQHLSVGIIV